MSSVIEHQCSIFVCFHSRPAFGREMFLAMLVALHSTLVSRWVTHCTGHWAEFQSSVALMFASLFSKEWPLVVKVSPMILNFLFL